MDTSKKFYTLLAMLGIGVVVLGVYLFTGNISDVSYNEEKVLASVSDVQVLILESFPVQVRVVVSGNLTCGNSALGDFEIEKQNNQFVIHFYELKPAGKVCLKNLVRFEESVPLDVYGLPAGEYTVSVNDVSTAFTLPTDNILQTDVSESEVGSYQGEILAGQSSPLLDFNEADYVEALESGKTVFLYFYARWCPTCKAEMRDATLPAFGEYAGDNLIGFRVNYNDRDADKLEESLAQEFGVLYQHTKVVIQNGEVMDVFPNVWTKEEYLDYFNSLAQ